jgi:competence protein ComFA
MIEEDIIKMPNPDFLFSPKMQALLSGRQLLLDELPFSSEELQAHLENGYLKFRKALLVQNSKLLCVRCGNNNKNLFGYFPCSRCGQNCGYCRKCLMMGRVSSCDKLWSWNGPSVVGEAFQGNILEWNGTLSDGQKYASDQLIEAVCCLTDILIWAVCGAGKTEVLFAGIEKALADGKRVCLATPRTDVVLELTPRLKKVFPNTSVVSLYGGSEDRHTFGHLTIATTHQLLRFYQAFDLMIVDEVDAFPYTADESLQYAVQQARKQQSSLIFLTATPNEQFQQECRTGKRHFVTIPARFHRKSLPVPSFVWCGNWKRRLEKHALPANVLNWARTRLAEQKQALIFFANIRLMEKAIPLFKSLDHRIESVFAEDPHRKEKVQSMRDRTTPLLLTTTILERGVTFPNIDVAVVGAEEDIFTESALVQIAGRVGRSPQYPSGNITFFHYGKTIAMIKARNQILQMNKQAYTKGLIDY